MLKRHSLRYMAGEDHLGTRIDPVLTQPRDKCGAEGVAVDRPALVIPERNPRAIQVAPDISTLALAGLLVAALERSKDGDLQEHTLGGLSKGWLGVHEHVPQVRVQRQLIGPLALRRLGPKTNRGPRSAQMQIAPPQRRHLRHAEPRPELYGIEQFPRAGGDRGLLR
jgi:hypothetical protein